LAWKIKIGLVCVNSRERFAIEEGMSHNPFPNESRLIENHEIRELINTRHFTIT